MNNSILWDLIQSARGFANIYDYNTKSLKYMLSNADTTTHTTYYVAKRRDAQVAHLMASDLLTQYICSAAQSCQSQSFGGHCHGTRTVGDKVDE